MTKAIFHKEWIKTKGYFYIMLLASLCFTGYSLLRMNRVVSFKGADHIWALLLTRDTIFIETLKYLPLAIGATLAAAQFIPEMQQKRLKLTLHLPYPQQQMILFMLLAGVIQLLVIFLVQYIVLWIYLKQIIAAELVSRILLTASVWYIGGLALYLLTAWICLEPTWKIRIINLLLTAGIIRILFLQDTPEAYNGFLLSLIIFTLLCTVLSLRSVIRFKEGCQD